MAALHDALKVLGPCDYSEAPLDDLQTFLPLHFTNAQLIVDSVPLAAPPNGSPPTETRSRSNTATSIASSASEISLSSARSAPPAPEVEALQKEWKPVKLGAKENPLGMCVYKMGGKDGKGSWFARRSVHEGLGFTKWKRALEMEFPESMKVQGGPGEGNIRGIGGETRVAYKNLEGVGKVEVYLLSAQFPGPTAPRDFVTMFITSDQALSDPNGEDVPRHFMVISKPCTHPEAPPREGYIRGQYESVEFIREIPINKAPKKSASSSNLLEIPGHTRNRSSTLGKEAILRNAIKFSPSAGESDASQVKWDASETDLATGGRARGKTISFDKSRGSGAKGERMDAPSADEDSEMNPVEWIMITRSDPGGSVPRFLIDRGTPAGIVGDASKFLNWACGKDIEDFDNDVEIPAADDQKENHQKLPPRRDSSLHNFQTNGHLAGLEEESSTIFDEDTKSGDGLHSEQQEVTRNGIYSMVTGGIGAAGGFITNYAPQFISDYIPGQIAASKPNGSFTGTQVTARRGSTSSISTISSAGSFASALEKRTTSMSRGAEDASGNPLQPSDSTASSAKQSLSAQEKELLKLEDKKRKLDLKLEAARERETSKKSEDIAKEEEAIRKATDRHEREIKKQEERYKKEVEKLRLKKEKEDRKAEEKRRKQVEKDERSRLLRELEEVKTEVQVLRKEREILKGQVGDLQKENTSFVVAVGRMGVVGEEVLRSVREDVGKKSAGIAGTGTGTGTGLALVTGRSRSDSIRNGLRRPESFRSMTSSAGDKDKEREKEKEKEKENVPLATSHSNS